MNDRPQPDPVNTEKRWAIGVCRNGHLGQIGRLCPCTPMKYDAASNEINPYAGSECHYERLEVIPASSVADLEAENERLKEALAWFMQRDPDVDQAPSPEEFWQLREQAESALLAEPTEENE